MERKPDKPSDALHRLRVWWMTGDERLEETMEHAYDEPVSQTLTEHVAEVETMCTLYARREHWQETKGQRLLRRVYTALSVTVTLILIGVLLYTTVQLPDFGNAQNPAHGTVPERYIEQGMQETGAVNIVAGMILDYRAFDTLGESNVLFIAVCTVLILLRISSEKDGRPSTEQLMEESNDRDREPKDDLILQQIAKILMPVALLFGMYIIMNGHLSPGGGFSGGTVMGAGLIFYLAAFGFTKTERFFTYRTFRTVSVCALSFYALSKAYSFFTGANGLPSFITAGTPGMLFSAGLIPYLNLAVGLIVCCTMYALYTLFRKGDL